MLAGPNWERSCINCRDDRPLLPAPVNTCLEENAFFVISLSQYFKNQTSGLAPAPSFATVMFYTVNQASRHIHVLECRNTTSTTTLVTMMRSCAIYI